jgi:hypothetical protein
MNASNSKNSTPAQYLEYLRERRGIEHARYIRDKLGWRWTPSAIYWTVRRHWLTWIVAAGWIAAWIIGIVLDVRDLLH